MLFVAVIDAPASVAGAQAETLPLHAADITAIVPLTDHTFEVHSACGCHNVDALVLSAEAYATFAHLRDHVRVFRADDAALTTRLQALRPRARTPNIDFDWPADA